MTARSAPGAPTARSTATRAATAPRHPAPTAASRPAPRSTWQALVDYHLAGVRRASLTPPPRLTDSSSWAALPLDREDLITGRGDSVPIPSTARRVLAARAPDDALHYGWPLAAVTDDQGRAHVAPLFVTELTLSADEGVAVARDDEPTLNPALLTERFFPHDVIAAAHDAVTAGYGFGDPIAVIQATRRVGDALGLAVGDLRPDALTHEPPRGPGLHNSAILVRGPSSSMSRMLVDELTALRTKTDWTGTAAAWLTRSVDRPHATAVPTDPAESAPPLPPITVSTLPLNDSQEQAVAASLTEPLTVVTGPPGTGKSQLVTAIVANQWLAGRSVLVASTNNGAVDVAVDRCAAIDRALLLRGGNQKAREQLPDLLKTLAARGDVAGPSTQAVARQLEVAAAGRAAVHERLEQRGRLEAELAQQLLDVELLRRTLWASREPHAARERLPEIERLAAKVSRSRFLRRRRRRRLLALAAPTTTATADDVGAWAAAESAVGRLTAALEALGAADPLADRTALTTADAAWATAGTTALRDTVQRRLFAGRAALQHLAGIRQNARGPRVQAVTRAVDWVPGWACTTLAAGSNFPLTAGLFDLLVIDEASQCSIAHVLPLAYRARRIVVVGDPNQLTPVVTLDRRAQKRLAANAGWTPEEAHRQAMSVGQDSAYTAYTARSPRPVHLLEEHFRCHPAIARFFNEEFYAGALRILTQVGDDDGVRGLHLVDVRGETERGPHGGVRNPSEADAVVGWIASHSVKGTVGVVTPFAAQAQLIDRRLRDVLGADEAARIRVGTAHKFQGDERDVMLFSPVLAGGAGERTARWVEDQRNLVNVAVSRAKRALVVVADTQALPDVPVPTLHRLIAMASERDVVVGGAELLREERGLHSEAERRLFAALVRAGWTPRIKEVVEGYELDLVLDTADGPLDVEVDGVHHTDARGRRRRQDLARDLVLERLGWRVARVPAWRALAEPDAAVAELVGLAPPGS